MGRGGGLTVRHEVRERVDAVEDDDTCECTGWLASCWFRAVVPYFSLETMPP